MNFFTTKTKKIKCLEVDEDKIFTNFKYQLYGKSIKPNNYKYSNKFSKKCNNVGEGSYNSVCITNTNIDKCYENVQVIVRESINSINVNTQQDKSTLIKSVENALFMSKEDIGPKIYDIIFTNDNRISIVMEQFQSNLKNFLKIIDHNGFRYENTKNIQKLKLNNNLLLELLEIQTINVIKRMSEHDMFCIDIKPKNSVINLDRNDTTLKFRFIDVDSDFCKPSELYVNVVNFENNNERNNFTYKFMIVLFACHLEYRLRFNYLKEVIYTQITEEDIQYMQNVINHSLSVRKRFTHYFNKETDIKKILNYDPEQVLHPTTGKEAPISNVALSAVTDTEWTPRLPMVPYQDSVGTPKWS